MPPISRTFPDLLREQALLHPNRQAAVHSGRSITYLELHEVGRKAAAALYALGIRRGDKVGLLMENRIEWLIAFFGASAVGATVVPFSTFSKAPELEFLINDSGICFLISVDRFGSENFLAALLSIEPQLSGLPHSHVFRSARLPHLRGIMMLGERVPGMVPFDSLSESRALLDLPPGEGPSATDDALVLYSSGSTSQPKAVHLQHYALIENGFNIGERQGLDEQDRVYLSAPLFWAYGSANGLPAAFSHGAALVLASRFKAGEALDLIERERCTAIYTLPSMTTALLEHPYFTRERTRTLRKGLTIGSPADVYRAAERLGASDICNLYGSSETCGNCCVTPSTMPLAERALCSGPPLPGVEIRIVDAKTGEPTGAGQVGQVQVRGYLMRRYGGAIGNDPSLHMTDDGYYRTGDLGAMLENGCFQFAGREDDMIKRAGVNISPAELEEILLHHPAVSQAAVVGTPDERRGNIVTAFVVPLPNAALSADDLHAHFSAMASRYKHPDRYVLSTALPVTNTGKVLRKALRTMAAEAQNA